MAPRKLPWTIVIIAAKCEEWHSWIWGLVVSSKHPDTICWTHD
jgi:hypothetical protein